MIIRPCIQFICRCLPPHNSQRDDLQRLHDFVNNYPLPPLATHLGITQKDIKDKVDGYQLKTASSRDTGFYCQRRNLYSKKLDVPFSVVDNGTPTEIGFGEAVRFAIAQIIKEKLELNEHKLFAHWHSNMLNNLTVSYDAEGILRITMGDGHLLQVNDQFECEFFRSNNPCQVSYQKVGMLPKYQGIVDKLKNFRNSSDSPPVGNQSAPQQFVHPIQWGLNACDQRKAFNGCLSGLGVIFGSFFGVLV